MYLLNMNSKVSLIEDVDKTKINIHLRTKRRSELLSFIKIPVFTEDKEARLIFNEILDLWGRSNEKMLVAKNYFNMIDYSIGANNLKTILMISS